MAKGATKREIQGMTFEFYPLSPKESLRILTRLVRLMGEPFGHIIDGAVSAGPGNILQKLMDGKIGKDGMAAAIRAMVNRLDEDEVEQTAFMLIDKVHGKLAGDKGPRPLIPDVDFSGEFPLFMEVLKVSIEVNFGPFFRGGVGGLIGKSGILEDTPAKAET